MTYAFQFWRIVIRVISILLIAIPLGTSLVNAQSQVGVGTYVNAGGAFQTINGWNINASPFIFYGVGGHRVGFSAGVGWWQNTATNHTNIVLASGETVD